VWNPGDIVIVVKSIKGSFASEIGSAENGTSPMFSMGTISKDFTLRLASLALIVRGNRAADKAVRSIILPDSSETFVAVVSLSLP
jgi:hypothetical protein